MCYTKYELRKLVGAKYVWVFFVIFLFINICLCVFIINKNVEWQIPKDEIYNIFELYQDDPERIESEYEALITLYEEREQLQQEAFNSHDIDYVPEPLPNKYIQSDTFNDLSLFKEIFGRKEKIIEYPLKIQKVINNAYSNVIELSTMKIPSDSYSYQYQLEVIDSYKNVQSKVNMYLEYTRGWGEYFDYDIVNIFIFAMIVIAGTVVFAQEKNSGFLPIILVSKNGRLKTALAKIAAMMIVTALIVLLFTATTWAVFGIRLGYSSAANAIQVFDAFTLSPYVITVGEYLAITVAIKFATFCLFATLVLAVSVFVCNYSLIYICGLGFYGVNFLLYTLRYINADNPFKNLNFVATAAVNPMFVRYRSINLFGNVVGYVPFMCVTFAVLFVAAVTVTVWRFNVGGEAVRAVWAIKAAEWIKATASKISVSLTPKTMVRRKCIYSRSIFAAELYKTLVASRYFFIILALLCVKCCLSNNEFTPRKSYSDAVYNKYMTTLAGEMTGEKRKYLTEERAYINETLAKQKTMQEAYINEEITFDEYREYLTDYNYAYSRSELLQRIESHAAYIDNMTERGIDAHFVYDTGWKNLFFTGFDVTLYAGILLLFAGIFADEYASRSSSGGFVQILRTTKYGRKKTFGSKFASASVITLILPVVWNAVDLAFIARAYELPLLSSPVQSIELFATVDTDISIGGYLALFFAVRIVAAVLLALTLCGLSQILCKNTAVMAVTVALTLFPALLDYFGLTALEYADYTGFLRATPMVRLSAAGENGFAYAAVFAGIAVAATLALNLKARRGWGK